MTPLLAVALVAALMLTALVGLGAHTTITDERRRADRLKSERDEARRQVEIAKVVGIASTGFEQALQGRPNLADLRARRLAAGFDPDAVDWTEGSAS